MKKNNQKKSNQLAPAKNVKTKQVVLVKKKNVISGSKKEQSTPKPSLNKQSSEKQAKRQRERRNNYEFAKYKRTPHEKEPFKRFAVYHRFLKRGATKQELLDAVNREIDDPIGKSQFYVDMQYIQSHLGVVLATPEKNGRERIYRYDDTYSGLKINEMSADIIEDILKVVQHLKRMEFFSFEQVVNEDISDVDVSDLIVKLSSLVNRTEQEYRSVIDDGTLLDYVGNKYLTLLYDAIMKCEVLSIEYAPFGKTAYAIEFHPYFLKRYNDRWFVIGYDGKNKKLPLLALDRIQTTPKVLGVKYKQDRRNWRDEYFDEFVGVSRNEEKVQTIRFRVVKDRAGYVQTKPIHATQKHIRDGQSAEYTMFEITVIPNRELIQQFLSFGADVEVLEPASVRLAMAEHFERGRTIYAPSKSAKATKSPRKKSV